MERLGKRFLVANLMLMLTTSFLQAATNKLTKAYHHLNTDAATTNLEIGSLVFYFDQEPQVKQLTGNKNQAIFFFPHVEISGSEVQTMLDAINASKANNYSVKLDRTKSPESGLKLIITYNPEFIGLSYDQFRSINMQKGIVFHMHNKDLLSKIKDNSHKPVLSLASLPALAPISVAKRRVVIDCGHGGTDTGAIGCAAVQEKAVILPIGLEVARILKDKGVDVVMTRTADSTIGLDQRTALANTSGADAFVSIHANSAPNALAQGIEIFCVHADDFKKKFATLSPDEKKIADSFFLNRCTYAQLLADALHENILSTLHKKKYSIVDRQVKNAASQVLLGAHMPAVLIEVGFVTHERESRLLASSEYQHAVAQGISNGILAFFQTHNA